VSSGSSGAGYTGVYVFLAILVLIAVRRLRVVLKGSKVSRARTWGFSGYYVVIAAFFSLSSFTIGGASPVYALLYVAVGAAGAYGSYLFSDRRIGFWRGADGSIYSKGAVVIYLVYIAGLIARIGIGIEFIGPQAFSFVATPGAPPPGASAVEAGIVTDVLLALGAGLLVGRNVRVLKRYSLIVQGKETVTDTPPKISLT
jgi:hypothetical protein